MVDEKIIAQYWNRDETAISATAEKYGPYCYSIAWNILQNPEDSEECVNDTWYRAWNAIPPQRPGRLKLFLAKITRNLAFDCFRAMSAQKRAGQMTLILEELSQCIPAVGSAEEEVMADELRQAINSFVRRLPAREGNIFVRRYFFAESLQQISGKYGMSANSVAVSLSRTRKKLRAYLESEEYLP